MQQRPFNKLSLDSAQLKTNKEAIAQQVEQILQLVADYAQIVNQHCRNPRCVPQHIAKMSLEQTQGLQHLTNLALTKPMWQSYSLRRISSFRKRNMTRT
eukprot:c43578_g1_i1 orf=680-976(+)